MQLGLSHPTSPDSRRIAIPRAAAVTLGLGVAGAVIGAPIGAAVFGAVYLLQDFYWCYVPSVPDTLAGGGIVGAGFGFLALPFTAWTRPRVAFGRIISATTLATVAAGSTAFVVAALDHTAPLLAALAGFVYAASRLGAHARSVSADLEGERLHNSRVP